MLVEFRTKGFKNFRDEICFNLSDIKNYEFNAHAIKDGIVKTALIYGDNGSGKTNLGYAMFDIIVHLTDKQRDLTNYSNYLNLDMAEQAYFYYKFIFDGSTLEYSYTKKDVETLFTEEVKINGEKAIAYNHITHEPFIKLEGAKSLNTDLSESNISFVKYVSKNSVLKETKDNKVFKKFIAFVDNMLLFSSLERNRYQGYKFGSGKIAENIVKAGKLKDFQKFLKNCGISYQLEAYEKNDEIRIQCKFKKTKVDFYSIASKGTTSLTLFYNWLIELNKVSLVFIDEFDAFYHSDVARQVVEEVLSLENTQGIITTHNTDIMSNGLLRPDCYFQIKSGKMASFANSTPKVLREAHNLQKMYKAKAFENNGNENE